MYESKWPFFTGTMIQNVSDVLRSGKVNQWTGNKVTDFQNKFSEHFGVKHSICVANGSVALELCLIAIDLKLGDEVIVTPRSFIASASSVDLRGGMPVFVDVDENSQNITLETIQKACTDNTKAVILVHLAGWPCDVEEIVQWCHSKNIYVIEDCAQSHGAKYNGKYVGTYGDINAWSFCQDKIITTGGEGGMVTTNNTELFKIAWSYKDHGKNYDIVMKNEGNDGFKWLHSTIGTNWRMTEMQASIGMDALDKLEEWITIRRRNADIFNQKFKNLEMIRLTIPNEKCYHAYYKYYMFVRPEKIDCSRDDVIRELRRADIPCFQGTCGEIYKEQAYGLSLELPITKKLTENSLMLLVDPSYDIETIIDIADKIKEVLISHKKIY